jgi:hypothetical protein
MDMRKGYGEQNEETHLTSGETQLCKCSFIADRLGNDHSGEYDSRQKVASQADRFTRVNSKIDDSSRREGEWSSGIRIVSKT